MKVLLDTCTVIWGISNPDALSPYARTLLEIDDTQVFVSPISAAEIACAVERGRIELNQHWRKWFRNYVELNRWQLVDMSLNIIEEAYSLPGEFHSDPADRILTATSRVNNFTLLTSDKKILDYPHVNAAW